MKMNVKMKEWKKLKKTQVYKLKESKFLENDEKKTILESLHS
jgi:hypothetical protein